jgi:prophage DNA circulation protein
VTQFPRPSLTLAQRLYQDPSRDAELVLRTGAVHPGFLPETGIVAAA